MRKHAKEAEYDDEFLQLWKKTEREFFKCEAQQTYSEPGEELFLRLFREQKFNELTEALEADVRGPESIWSEARIRNIQFVRVHVISPPLSEYIRFEIEAYKVQALAGERIYIAQQAKILPVLSQSLCDFVMFDEKIVLTAEYDAKGVLMGGIITDEYEDIARFKIIKSFLIENAQKLEDFLVTL